MKERTLAALISRLVRSKNANMIWVVRDQYEIKQRINQISEMSQGQIEYRPSTRILQLGNVTVRFITENDDSDKLCGLLIDEVIIDELQ